MQEPSSIKDPPAASIILVTLLSLTGCNNAEVSLYMNPITKIFIIGSKIIDIRITTPNRLTEFFKSKV